MLVEFTLLEDTNPEKMHTYGDLSAKRGRGVILLRKMSERIGYGGCMSTWLRRVHVYHVVDGTTRTESKC